LNGERSPYKINVVRLKLVARVILLGIVFIAALSYVVDFLNPLTPDPPVILKSLQWRILVTFVASILPLNLQTSVIIRSLAASRVKRPTDVSRLALDSSTTILDLTCSRLI
jgi:hypothetical protein